MSFKRRVILAPTLILAWAGETYGAPEAFDIRFGILKYEAEQDRYVSQETLRIPMSKGGAPTLFGYTIEGPRGRRFTCRETIHYPTPPANLTGALAQAKKKEDGRVVQTDNTPFTGRGYAAYYFHEGDPLGVHRMEIFVDDKLTKTVVFEVLAGDRPPTGEEATGKTPPPSGPPMRMFVALDSEDEDAMRFALLFGIQSSESPALKGLAWELEILAGGRAVFMFLQGSPVLPEYEKLRGRKANVKLLCCGETITKMKKQMGAERVQLLPGAEVVPSCDKRFKQLKDEGWVRIVPPED